ncbi:dnaJ homolog subfamily C member 21 [Eurosta solidaginis]|uniref:dnaJ homolog subfamily C member 21 n=1 Tax=Eurosta solidaginis TaxID=178769 RepID=UPI0035315829
MKCYYEELGVPRDANDADIKIAYRKLALRWHPDKNPDSANEAKERFQLIQQAYEVLSDPQERAWYDNHRDQILRGKNSDYTEKCLDVFEYFTSSCFKGYDDDEKGFYAVYREVFNKIAAEDAEFMDDENEVGDIRTFGDSKSSYDDVVAPFYAYWQSYCTKKTYTWLCPYDVKEIKDRRVLREVEKEMKKLVQKARKERNEEVRNLVSFVRKRDKRVQAYRKLLEERAELNRKKQEQNRLEQIRKRQRELQEMREQNKQNDQHKNDDYEAQLKQLAQDYGDSSAEEDSDDTGDEEEDVEGNENEEVESTEEYFYVDDLYCVACNKMFKNDRAYENHESSKRHREALERMKVEMQAEEEAFQENNEDVQESEEEVLDSQTGDSADEKTVAQSDKREVVDGNTEIQSDDASAAEELVVSIKSKKSKKARKNAKLNKSQVPGTEDDNEHEDEAVAADFLEQAKIADSDEEDWSNSAKKSARKNKSKKQNKKTAARDEEVIKTNEDEIKMEPKKADPKATQQKKPPKTQTEQNLVGDSTDEDEGHAVKKPTSKSKSKASESSSSAASSNHVCVTCNANFPSKNKLFSHLKIMNHGVYIPKATNDTHTTAAEGSKSKKSKGKRK